MLHFNNLYCSITFLKVIHLERFEMATTKPRVNVTLEQADYDILKRLSELSGTPMSRQIADLVQIVVPVLSQMADNFEKLKQADETIKNRLRISADNGLKQAELIQQQALELHSDFSNDFQAVLEDVIKAAEGVGNDTKRVADRRQVRGVADTEPPYSNTGVRSKKVRGVKR